jgi:hypothetical protein
MKNNEKPAAGGQPARGPKARLAEGSHYSSEPAESKAEFFDDEDFPMLRAARLRDEDWLAAGGDLPPVLRGGVYAALNGMKPREGEWEIDCPIPQRPGFSHRCRVRETASGTFTIKCFGGHLPAQVRHWLKHHWATSGEEGGDECA